MIAKLARRSLIRLFSTTDQLQTRHSSFLTESEQQKSGEVPVHLRPYDKAKYEVPTKKIKRNSGYAMVQIEPFPRARIMRICYNILADVKNGIPETSAFRILTEQKMKYIMNIVDKEDDPQQLQRLLGNIPLELFIRNLSNQFMVIENMRRIKPWEVTEQQEKQLEQEFVDEFKIKQQPKYPAYRRPERTKSVLL